MSQKINVNITPNSLAMPTLYFSQGDVGRVFTIEVVSSDGYDIPSGATVKIQATKPSGFGFSVTGTVTDNIVEFTSTSEMTDEAGRFFADLEITSGGTLIGTANFCMCGEADPHPDGTIDGSAESIVPQLTLLVERVENAAAAVLDTTTVATTLPAGSQATYSFDESTNTATFGIPQGEAGAGAAGVVASAYSASQTYAVGDYAIHNSNLYRCTTEITTAESFTAAHWTQVVLADDVTDLKSELTHNNAVMLADAVPTNYTFIVGGVNGGDGEENDSLARAKTDFIPYINDELIVEADDDYLISVAYYDENKTWLISHWWYGSPYKIKGYSRSEIQNTKYVKIVLKRVDENNVDIIDVNAKVKIGKKGNYPRTYTVKPSGGGDFTSLVDAIFVAEQHMDSTVYLDSGVYDILTDLGSTFINSVDASNRGIYLKNRIHLIGSGDTLITCLYDGTRELTAKWLAIFNAGEYGFTIENLRLSAKNIRYVIHDERDSDEDLYINKYINCRMVFDNTENQYSNAVQCIGGGLGLHGVIVVDNCYFNSINSQSVAFPAVSYHNSADVDSKNGMSLIIISNSFFENNNTVRINYYGNSTKITQAFINNNSLGKDILSGAETQDSSSANVNVNVNAFNNIVRDNPIITAILGTLDIGFTNTERCDNLVNVSFMATGVDIGTAWTDVAYVSKPPTKNQLFTAYDHNSHKAIEGYILSGTGHIYMRASEALSNCSVRAGFSYSIA